MSFGAPPPTENCCVHCPSDRAKRDDPPKGKRLREWWIGERCYSHNHEEAFSYQEKGCAIKAREVSPERDEIVAASLDWDATAATPDALLSVGALRLRRAVEAWKRAGRPA